MTAYPERFVWRGLEFTRDPQLGYYRSGNWVVSDAREEGREAPWWQARWQSTQFQATLAPKGHAESYEMALERCLGRVREHARAQAVKMEDLQRDLSLMSQEKEALVRDLLALIPDGASTGGA